MRTNIDGLSRYSLWGIFVLALAARLLYWYQAADNPLMYIPLVDEEYHADYGRSLAGGNWLGESQPFFMDPLYGYFLGAVFWIFGDNLAIARLIQLFVDGVTAVLLVSVGRRLQFPAAGMIAGALYACYPVAWFYSLLLLKTTLTTHVLVLFVWLLLGKGVSSRLLTWLGLGVLAGIGVYLRGNLILLVPLAVGWLLLQRHRPLSRTAAPALLLIAGMGIVLLAGGARNAAVSGQFVMLPRRPASPCTAPTIRKLPAAAMKAPALSPSTILRTWSVSTRWRRSGAWADR